MFSTRNYLRVVTARSQNSSAWCFLLMAWSKADQVGGWPLSKLVHAWHFVDVGWSEDDWVPFLCCIVHSHVVLAVSLLGYLRLTGSMWFLKHILTWHISVWVGLGWLSSVSLQMYMLDISYGLIWGDEFWCVVHSPGLDVVITHTLTLAPNPSITAHPDPLHRNPNLRQPLWLSMSMLQNIAMDQMSAIHNKADISFHISSLTDRVLDLAMLCFTFVLLLVPWKTWLSLLLTIV